jgi:uncharacterized membrane protein
MGYIICEACGGYYELQSGEYADDFENCQCGGNLKLVEDSFLMPEPEIKARFVCSNCLEENEAGLYCSKCGGRLISINNKNNETKSGISYDRDHIERLARNSKNASRNRRSNYSNNSRNSSKEPSNILDNISWLGVIVGAGFLIGCTYILVIGLFFTFGLFGYSYYYYDSSLGSLVLVFFVLLLILAIMSGVLASIIGKKIEYIDGLFNGFLVGFISSFILSILSWDFLVLILGSIILGALAAVGGSIGIFIRNQGYLKS